MIFGKGIFVNNMVYPSKFTYFQTIFTTSSFISYFPGWYRFHVVGRGGSGGKGGAARSASLNTGEAISSGGSSGSTGAYAIHDLYMKNGDYITVYLDSEKTFIVFGGDSISAMNGVNGLDGLDISNNVSSDRAASPVNASDASRVVAVGGNVVNINAVSGNGSRQIPDNIIQYRGGGYGNYIPNNIAIYTPKQPIVGNAPSDAKNLGGSGAGGNGVATMSNDWRYGDPGYSGGSGGVVVEKGVY